VQVVSTEGFVEAVEEAAKKDAVYKSATFVLR
jgi:hypothetical protein